VQILTPLNEQEQEEAEYTAVLAVKFEVHLNEWRSECTKSMNLWDKFSGGS